MTKDELEKKAEGLRSIERQHFANYNAALGARQFCEHLIKEMEVKEEPKKPAAKVKK